MKKLCVAIAAALALTARADEGRIPIYQATTISQSGSYVLTRDLSISSGSAITITGNPNVILDLAGHTIVSSSATAVFTLNFTSGFTSPCGSLTLRNGEVKGNGSGVTTVVGRQCQIDLKLEGMRFNNADVYVEDGSVSAISNRFYGSDLFNDANFTAPSALIEWNQFILGGITVFGNAVAQIRHNNLQSGSIVANGSDGFAATEHIIEANTLAGGGIQVGQSGTDGVVNLAVIGNVATGAIQVRTCQGFRIADNVISGCAGGSGITLVEGSKGLIEGNRVRGCTNGISFDSLSNDNAWRNNMLRNNTSAVLNNGLNNTDAGGNVF